MKMLSVVIVNYNSQKYIPNCLNSLKNQNLNIPIQVILVNSDNSNFKINLDSFSKGSMIIDTVDNRGFGSSVNKGVTKATGDYLLILNPDVIVKGGLSEALEYVINNDSIVGANLLLPSGVKQKHAFGNFHSLTTIMKNKAFGFSIQRFESEVSKVDWVSGTAMLMKRKIFDKLHCFDESFFMYFEDQDLCFRANEIGVFSYVLKGFRVTHFGGKSFKKSKIQLFEYNKSLKIYLSKHSNIVDRIVIGIIKPMYDSFKSK